MRYLSILAMLGLVLPTSAGFCLLASSVAVSLSDIDTFAGKSVAVRVPIIRSFQFCGAAHPSTNFWVEPEILQKLVNAVKAGKMNMVSVLCLCV